MRRLWLSMTGVAVITSATMVAATMVKAPGSGTTRSGSDDAGTIGSRETGPRTHSYARQPQVTIAPRPNIVFVMVDDMRDDDLRFMPNTMALVRDRGVRFVNSFSPYPLCCPARTSVLTGLYTHNHKVYDVTDRYGFHAFDDRSTLATLFHAAGYSTVYLGKYLNRYGIAPPHDRTGGSSLHYVPPGWTDWRASLDGGFPAGSPDLGSTYWFDDTTLSRNGQGFEPLTGQYQTRAYGRIAGHIIRARAAEDRPFLLYLSFTAPHHGTPVEPDDPAPTRRDDGEYTYWDTTARPDDVKGSWDRSVTAAPGGAWDDPDFHDKPRYLRRLPPLNAAERSALLEVTRQRAEALTVVDQQVRGLMRVLEDTGELDRTLVVFTSDNGYFLGEQHMRQGKIYPHEPSLRVPLLMRGPGIPPGATRRDPFTSVDYLPTLATAAGIRPARAVDGVSMWHVAIDGDQGWTRGILTETGAVGHRPRATNETGAPLSAGGRRDVRFLIGIRTARYLYVDVAHERNELYDLKVDPHEYVNLFDKPRYAAVQTLLEQQLGRLRTCRGATCSARLPSALRWQP